MAKQIIRAVCPQCGQIFVISNEKAIQNYLNGIGVVCPKCSEWYSKDYIRGFYG